MPADIIINQNDTEIIKNVKLKRLEGVPPSIILDAENGNISLGRLGQDGDLILMNREGNPAIFLNGSGANAHLGGEGQDGDLLLKDANGETTIHLNGSGANIHLGGPENKEGDLFVYDNDGDRSIHLNGQSGTTTTKKLKADEIILNGVGDLATKIADIESGSPSDQRLKHQVRPLNDAATKVQHLQAVRFKWKAFPRSGDQIGLMAQDVQKIIPEAVSQDSQGIHRINYNCIVATLLETIKEQTKQMTVMEKQLSEMDQRLSQLETRL